MDRPPCIAHWTEIEQPDDHHYSGDDELLSIGAPLAEHFGVTRLGIHHERLPPGRRTSYPHAESAEDEFVFVLEGEPDVWLNGRLHRLEPGDAVGFPAGTGICHTFINNTEAEVRLLVVGERPKAENRVFYPLNPERKPLRDDWWENAPTRLEGDHDGLPDRVRTRRLDR
jgi:uncharacterized cupin superfamily protein